MSVHPQLHLLGTRDYPGLSWHLKWRCLHAWTAAFVSDKWTLSWFRCHCASLTVCICCMSLVSFVGCVLLCVCSALCISHLLYLAFIRAWYYYSARLLKCCSPVWHAFWRCIDYHSLTVCICCPYTVFCPMFICRAGWTQGMSYEGH